MSGMRPTGRLHIGHYFGALQNWVRLQNAILPSGSAGGASPAPTDTREYECFYFIADWHALTSEYADTSAVAENTIEIATDYLAAGLDPERSVIFQQSLVPEHAELHLLLGMVTPLSWLERVPTYKEQLENVTTKDLHNYGFLGYPCLQTADIVIYGENGVPLLVPVGEDQVSHVELSREIVRRFSNAFSFHVHHEKIDASSAKEFKSFMKQAGWRGELKTEDIVKSPRAYAEWIKKVAMENGHANFAAQHGRYSSFFEFIFTLTEPEHQLTATPRIPGLDGRKMSKSYGNAIMLSETNEDIYEKTKVMVTDPARQRRSDPGNPDVCPVYDWHKLFSAGESGRLEWVRQGCTTARIGCIECKTAMADNLVKWIAPIRDRRLYFQSKRKLVREIIQDGSADARKVAIGTMRRVRDAIFGKSRILRPSLKRLKTKIAK